ncbi:MAG: DbpA RNA binding domain-containing protein [Rectinemataceae bacterium]|nr:DbpA RNA binding domain-containing protein [Rectinemataceae bacterium]
MPSDPSATTFSADALDAFLEGLLAELKSPADPVMLGQIRASFRRKIPFHLRSYAAAILIMRAAGLSRGVSARPQQEVAPAPAPVKPAEPRNRNPRKTVLAGDPSTRPAGKSSFSSGSASAGSGSFGSGSQFPEMTSHRQPAPAAVTPKKPVKEVPAKAREEKIERAKPRNQKPEVQETAAEVLTDPTQATAPKPRQTSWALSVPSTPLFVSMGRRQRLRAAEIRELFIEKSGLGADEVGQVRLFDNYCFVDIATDKAQIATEAMNGAQLRGRAISVGPAKPRGEMAREAADAGNSELASAPKTSPGIVPSSDTRALSDAGDPGAAVASMVRKEAWPQADDETPTHSAAGNEAKGEVNPADEEWSADAAADHSSGDEPIRGQEQL